MLLLRKKKDNNLYWCPGEKKYNYVWIYLNKSRAVFFPKLSPEIELKRGTSFFFFFKEGKCPANLIQMKFYI